MLVWGCDGGDAEGPNSKQAKLRSEALELHQSLITIDTHVDIPETFATSEVDPGVRGNAQLDLVKMSEGNLNTAFFIVYVEQGERTQEGYALAKVKAMRKFNAIRRMTDELYPDRIGFATSANDIEQIRAAGKLVALIGVENGFAFGDDLSLVQSYYDIGMRYAGFAHFGHSNFSDSSMPKEALGDAAQEHGGLSDLGRELLSELNRLGVMADVSHASKKTVFQVADLSTAPIIASHSDVYALNPHPRNLTDEEMIAIKETGGVVQIVAYDTYLKDPPQEKKEAVSHIREKFGLNANPWSSLPDSQKTAFLSEISELHKQWPKASVSDLTDHIDYAVKLIGIDHVGIASDFGGGGGVGGWEDASETSSVTEELLKRGYTADEIQKLWSGNIMRVMTEVQKLADDKAIEIAAPVE